MTLLPTSTCPPTENYSSLVTATALITFRVLNWEDLQFLLAASKANPKLDGPLK